MLLRRAQPRRHPPTLAASELFGHVEGAFSGARGRNVGYFGRADGGTLFLDEIGETPVDVQPTPLRALESGEVQQIGARGVRRVDVRLIAATDADLEGMARAGSFRAPLIYRLATHEIRIPPLRERHDDIGRLLRHFLADELTKAGRVDELRRPPTQDPWLPGPVVERLACYDWPGNVRQLRNVSRVGDRRETRVFGDVRSSHGTEVSDRSRRGRVGAGGAGTTRNHHR